MQKFALVVGFTAMLAATTAGCAPKLFRNDAYVNKLRRGKDKLLIMPVVFHRFPNKMKTDLETSIFVRFIARFGKYGYSVQPLVESFDAAGFANLPWQLTQGMYHVASVHKSSHMSKFRSPGWLGTMLASARKFANWAPYALRIGGVQIPPGYKFRYILTAMVSKIGAAPGGGTVRYRVVGGIVDVKKQQIVCATWFERSSKNDLGSIAADLRDLGQRLQPALKLVFVK
jgi:hypothetical protein